jgi:HAD superfamily hydrolase (TIGR01509 family)
MPHIRAHSDSVKPRMKNRDKPRLRAITFDLDNTLWESAPVLREAEAAQNRWLLTHRPLVQPQLESQTLLALRRQLCERDDSLLHHISRLRRSLLYELQLACGYDAASAEQGAEQAFSAFYEARHRVELHPAANAILSALRQHYTLGALTNGNADVFRTPAGVHFDFAFRAEELGSSKPEAPLFEAALKHTGLPPQAILHVGDSLEHDVEGAARMGMRTVWLRRDQPIDDTAELATAVINDLNELAGAIAALETHSR